MALSQYLKDYTTTVARPSAGVLQEWSTKAWDRAPSDFSTVDSHGDEKVRFSTQVEVTCSASSRIPEAALQRWVSHLIVAQLSGEDLKDACEQLLELYRWRSMPPVQARQAGGHIVVEQPQMKFVSSRPFEFDEG